MDEYVTKPIEPQALRETILGLGLQPPVQSSKATEVEDSDDLSQGEKRETPTGLSVTIDHEAILKRAGGNQKVVDMVQAELLKQLPTSLKKLSTAVEARNKQDLKSTAHAFRGMVANFGAPELTEPLRELEHLEPEQAPEQADELLLLVKSLTGELERGIRGD